MEFFARQGYDTWCVDMEGYGRSTKTRDNNAPIAFGAKSGVLIWLVLFAFTGCLNNGQSSCVVIGCMLAAAWVVGEQVAAASGWKPFPARRPIWRKCRPAAGLQVCSYIRPRSIRWLGLPMIGESRQPAQIGRSASGIPCAEKNF